jgi:hypothetical protein
METATARFVAFADSAPILVTDVDDLHEADQDAVLGDRLADAQGPAARAGAVAHLVGQPGRAALLAHELSTRASRMALLSLLV